MTHLHPKAYTFHKFGEQAILINFKQEIDEAVNQQVLRLNAAIQSAALTAIRFTIPAYCSLTVGYDPTLLAYETLCHLIADLATDRKNTSIESPTRQLLIPVCYDQEFALDLTYLAKEKGMTEEEVIQCHSQQTYKVYMLGFLPGFTFMGKVPAAIAHKRKSEPRLKVPASSVGIAGEQTGIYPAEVPGGWQIIGRTPLPIFDPTKEQPFLFQAGDQVQFYTISKKEFVALQADIASTSFNWQTIYE